MDLKEFLSALCENNEDHYFYIWSKADNRSDWYNDPEKVPVEKLDGKPDQYIGVGLLPKPLTRSPRPFESEVCGIFGLWLDVDVMSPDAHKVYPETKAEAMALIQSLALQPSIVVDSGGGFQAWYLFRDPWIFHSDAERAAAKTLETSWWGYAKREAEHHGWTLDSVFDLSRSMRLPDTLNTKYTPQRRSAVVMDTGVRYLVDDFEPYVVAVEPDSKSAPAVHVDENLVLDPDAQPPFDKFQAMAGNDAFMKAWNHQRKEWRDQSASAYDMSLCSLAVFSGTWTDQELVNLMVYHRKRYGANLKRIGYYRLTIKQAKESLRRSQAEENLAPLIGPTASDVALDGEEREQVIEDLSALLAFPLKRIIKYVGREPVYYMYTARGRIMLGDVDGLIAQQKFRSAVAALTGIYVPEFTRKKWQDIAQLLLNVVEEEELGDEFTETGLIGQWLHLYLAATPVALDYKTSIDQRIPFPEEGFVHIYLDAFVYWLKFKGENPTKALVATILRGIGAVAEAKSTERDGHPTSFSVWKLPAIFGVELLSRRGGGTDNIEF